MFKLTGPTLPDCASGILKEELRTLNSLIHCADETAVPAGGVLAVDRDMFAVKSPPEIENHPSIGAY
jgi:methylenetetrahydrofolate--tRNA-(uracil-5-)-methyltransferase